MHPRTAEALKYACNAFHATKVSFANELGRIMSRLGVDSREVMGILCEDTSLNISPKYLRPGFAFGGSCLPKDLRSLLYLARNESIDIPLLSGALSSNRLTIDEAIDRVVAGEGFRVALLGLSFKQGSDDLRESPYVDLAETLLGKGYDVRIHDPSLNPSSLIGANRQYVESKLPHLKRILTDGPEEALEDADIALVSHATPEVVTALLDLPRRRGSSISTVASGPRSRRWSATRDSPGDRPQAESARTEKKRQGSGGSGSVKRGRVLILVQNLSVPFDRRVWLECQSLIAAGFQVAVVCPKAPGDPTYYRFNGVDLYKYRPYAPGTSSVSFVLEYVYSFVMTLILSLRASLQRSIRRCAELQSSGPLLADRRPVPRPPRVVLRVRSPRSVSGALRVTLSGREPDRLPGVCG